MSKTDRSPTAADARILTLRKKDILKIEKESVIATIKPKLVAGLVSLIEREEDRTQFLTFCRRVDSTVRAWYTRHFDELMQLHSLLDPVSGARRLKQQQLSPAQVDRLEQKFLRNLFLMMEKSNFKMMTNEEVELANSGAYLLNLPIAVDKSKLDKKLLSTYFSENGEDSVPDFSNMYVIFRRGIGIDRTSGYFIMEKIDALVARFWNDVLCFLRLRKPESKVDITDVRSFGVTRKSSLTPGSNLGDDDAEAVAAAMKQGGLNTIRAAGGGGEGGQSLRGNAGGNGSGFAERRETAAGVSSSRSRSPSPLRSELEIRAPNSLVPSYGLPVSGTMDSDDDGRSSFDASNACDHTESEEESSHLFVERVRIENMEISFGNLFRSTTLQEPTFERIIVIYRKATARDDTSPLGERGINIKHFCNIPIADMEIVLPEKCNPGLTPSDTLKLIGTAMVGLVALISSLTSGGPVVGSIALAVLIGLGGYGLKIYTSFQAAQAEYQNLITKSLYDKQLDSGRATLLLLCDEVIQQEVKEVVLAFFVLMTQGRATLEELDGRCEQILEEFFHEKTDFDAEDALDKLEKLGIVTKDSLGRYGHVSLKQANDIIGVTTDELVLVKGMGSASGLRLSKGGRF